MNKLFLCGDIHTPIDIKKLNSRNFIQQKQLTKDDVLINLGDFGGFWYNKEHRKYRSDKYWLDWLCEKNYTFAFLDGNHENHEMLADLPIKDKWNGKVGYYKSDNDNNEIFYLKRGEIYIINGLKILIIGGAKSNDIESRNEGKNWWKGETLSELDKINVYKNLEKYNYEVDLILSHTCPKIYANELIKYLVNLKKMYNYYNNNSYIYKFEDETTNFLQDIYEKTKFKQWHFGHWHMDYSKEIIDEKLNKKSLFACHYNNSPKLIQN